MYKDVKIGYKLIFLIDIKLILKRKAKTLFYIFFKTAVPGCLNNYCKWGVIDQFLTLKLNYSLLLTLRLFSNGST